MNIFVFIFIVVSLKRALATQPAKPNSCSRVKPSKICHCCVAILLCLSLCLGWLLGQGKGADFVETLPKKKDFF